MNYFFFHAKYFCVYYSFELKDLLLRIIGCINTYISVPAIVAGKFARPRAVRSFAVLSFKISAICNSYLLPSPASPSPFLPS